MVTVPEELKQSLVEHNQEHVLAGWNQLNEPKRPRW